MADYYTNICFKFEATDEQATALVVALEMEGEAFDGLMIPPVLSSFITKDELQDICADDSEVTFGDVEIQRDGTDVTVSGMNPYLEPLAKLIQAVMKPEKPIGFQWSNDCSKHRLDAFGGGCCAIFKDRIEFENTSTRLEALLDG